MEDKQLYNFKLKTLIACGKNFNIDSLFTF